jgi:hypothetical protein
VVAHRLNAHRDGGRSGEARFRGEEQHQQPHRPPIASKQVTEPKHIRPDGAPSHFRGNRERDTGRKDLPLSSQLVPGDSYSQSRPAHGKSGQNA